MSSQFSLQLFGNSKLRFVFVTSFLAGHLVYFVGLTEKQRRKFRTNRAGIARFIRLSQTGMQIKKDFRKNVLATDEKDEVHTEILEQFHERTAERILNAALINGGLYIKLGQAVAACNHLFPQAYVSKLSELNDRVLTAKEDDVDQLLMEDFGKSLNEIFSQFNRVPIASASIAEVFEGTLRHSGEKVAVKMQYIDLQDRFTGDIWTIKLLMDIAEWVFPGFNFKWAVNELCDTLRQELDFINEAHNSEKCALDLKHFKYVYVPKVFWDYTSKRVLTTEFIDACKVDDKECLKSRGIDVRLACERMCKVFGYQIFQSGFVHADPHPGNLFVRKNPDGSGDTQLVILDHGLYQRVEPLVQRRLGNFWKSMILDDQAGMLRDASSLGVRGLHDTAIFAAILLQRPWYVNVPFSSYFKSMTNVDFEHMSNFMENHFEKVMGVLRSMPLSLLLVVRNVNTIRSIVQTHDEPVNRYRIMTDCTIRRDWRHCGEYFRLQYRLFLMDAKEFLHRLILGLFVRLSSSGIPLFSKFKLLTEEVERRSALQNDI